MMVKEKQSISRLLIFLLVLIEIQSTVESTILKARKRELENVQGDGNNIFYVKYTKSYKKGKGKGKEYYTTTNTETLSPTLHPTKKFRDTSITKPPTPAPVMAKIKPVMKKKTNSPTIETLLMPPTTTPISPVITSEPTVELINEKEISKSGSSSSSASSNNSPSFASSSSSSSSQNQEKETDQINMESSPIVDNQEDSNEARIANVQSQQTTVISGIQQGQASSASSVLNNNAALSSLGITFIVLAIIGAFFIFILIIKKKHIYYKRNHFILKKEKYQHEGGSTSTGDISSIQQQHNNFHDAVSEMIQSIDTNNQVSKCILGITPRDTFDSSENSNSIQSRNSGRISNNPRHKIVIDHPHSNQHEHQSAFLLCQQQQQQQMQQGQRQDNNENNPEQNQPLQLRRNNNEFLFSFNKEFHEYLTVADTVTL